MPRIHVSSALFTVALVATLLPALAPAALAVQYTITDLGTLGGTQSFAYGINNSGQVVGYSDTSSGNQHAFLYSGGVMQDLGTLGGTSSGANGINNSGQVVGGSFPSSGHGHAFLYSGGVMQDLGTLSGRAGSGANGINTSGQVVGSSGGGAFPLTPSCTAAA